MKKNQDYTDLVVRVMLDAEHEIKDGFVINKFDVFIDDSVSNFIAMNLAGVPCLLYNKEYNQDWGPVGRVYSLDYDHIMETYELFIETVFKDFKKLLWK